MFILMSFFLFSAKTTVFTFLCYHKNCSFLSTLFLLFWFLNFDSTIFTLFLGGAPISLCHFFRPSVCPSVAHQISGSVHHLIINFGTHMKNDHVCRCFFHFLKILIFWAIMGVKGQKIAQNVKSNNYICQSHISATV